MNLQNLYLLFLQKSYVRFRGVRLVKKMNRTMLRYTLIGSIFSISLLEPLYSIKTRHKSIKWRIQLTYLIIKQMSVNHQDRMICNILNTLIFENLTGISQWVQNDMLDTSSKIPEFYSETNETGNLTDMTHNFEDFGVALDGTSTRNNL